MAHNIFVVMGKSASGKDTIYRELASSEELGLKEIVSYTTRPIRAGETEGVEYHFVTEDRLRELEEAGRVIEHRAYDTVHGIWHYFTVEDEQIDLKKSDYIMIGTLESYVQIVKFYGREIVKPVYIDVENGLRLMRALGRERAQKEPKYKELCRRFLADEEDFSEEKIKEAGITFRFENNDLDECIAQIKDYMQGKSSM